MKLNNFIVAIVMLPFLEAYASEEDLSQPNNGKQIYQIQACSRKIQSVDENKPAFKNVASQCFMRFVSRSENDKRDTIDSRGYFGDAGSIQEPEQYLVNETCQMLKLYESFYEAAKDWDKVKKVYNDHRNPDHYRLLSHNCCTVADEAAQQVAPTKFLRSQNFGFGTSIKIDSDKGSSHSSEI